MELDVLKESIAAILQVYIKEIELDSTFASDLGADSIDLMQILNLVEEKLDIQVDLSEVSKVVTVGDALALIQKAKSE